MERYFKKVIRKNEFYVLITIIVLCAVIAIVDTSGSFFSLGNAIDTLRSMTTTIIFALAAMMVIITGGIDVSFPAVAAFSMYTATKILSDAKYDGPIWIAFVISAGIGLLLGLFNATVISYFRLPAFIATLGTQSLYFSVVTTFVGSKQITNLDLPVGITNYSKDYLVSVQQNNVLFTLPAAFIFTVVIALIVFFILRYTMLGRGIYALGGDRVAARRAGFNVRRIEFFVFAFVGLISGIAGMIHTTLRRNSFPYDLSGSEMLVIAAVVLGGTRITGGYGTVTGTILGVLLVTIVNNNMVLLGIPSQWQTFVTGLLILIGTGITAYQSLKARRKVQILEAQ
jgi:simple sugar transport system permease protein